jgi:predicted nuclease with TOPRIM domain
MKEYSELAERYNKLVRKYNSRILLLKELSGKNAALRSEVNKLKNERDELQRRVTSNERNLIGILVHLSLGRSNPKELLRLLGSMALTDKDGTICMTTIRFSKDAIEYARDKGVTIIEEPKGTIGGGLVGSYQNI